MRHTRYIPVAMAFLPFVFSGPSWAQEVDEAGANTGAKITAGLGLQTVDNLFASSTNKVSDTITTGTVGLSSRTTYSRQTVVLDATVSDNEYWSHSNWNYTGSNLSAGWQWTSGIGFHGGVSASRVVARPPATTNLDGSQPNLNTTRNSQATLGYTFDGGWDITSGLVYSSSRNQAAVIGQAGYQYSGVYVGATYTFRSGNTLTLTTQRAHGSNGFDYDVHSNELRFRAEDQGEVSYSWSVLQWHQSYESNPEYDFSALGGGMQIQWPITSKTSVGLSAQRSLYGNPGADSIYSTLDSVALTPAWEISPKLTLRGTVQYGALRDRGMAAARDDRFQMQSVILSWAWLENVLIAGGYTRTTRTSAIDSDFVVNTLSLQATYTF